MEACDPCCRLKKAFCCLSIQKGCIVVASVNIIAYVPMLGLIYYHDLVAARSDFRWEDPIIMAHVIPTVFLPFGILSSISVLAAVHTRHPMILFMRFIDSGFQMVANPVVFVLAVLNKSIYYTAIFAFFNFAFHIYSMMIVHSFFRYLIEERPPIRPEWLFRPYYSGNWPTGTPGGPIH